MAGINNDPEHPSRPNLFYYPAEPCIQRIENSIIFGGGPGSHKSYLETYIIIRHVDMLIIYKTLSSLRVLWLFDRARDKAI